MLVLDFPAGPQFQRNDIGLAWVTQPDARALAQSAAAPPSYVLNLKLNDPAAAPAFASKYGSNTIGSTRRERPADSVAGASAPRTACWCRTSSRS